MDEEGAKAFGSALSSLLAQSGEGVKRKEQPEVDLPESSYVKRKKAARKREAEKEREEGVRRVERMKMVEMAHVIPDAATGIETERRLKRTATKGAVALFNAVAKVQKESQKTPAKSKIKKKQGVVGKEEFMNMLKKQVTGDEEEQEEVLNGERPEWDALDDSTVPKNVRSLKNWDQQEENSDDEMLNETIDVSESDDEEDGGDDSDEDEDEEEGEDDHEVEEEEGEDDHEVEEEEESE